MELKTLIDKAAEIVGSRYKLGKELGVSASTVYDWESGIKTCSPGDRARLAGFAREDAVQELVRATIETAKGEKRKEQLLKVLGKSLHQTGAALHTAVLTVGSLTFGTAWIGDYFTRCIEVLNRKRSTARA